MSNGMLFCMVTCFSCLIFNKMHKKSRIETR